MSEAKRFDLSGKVVVITGGVGFLGGILTEAVSEVGGAVAFLDIDGNKLKEKVKQLKAKLSTPTLGIKTDITNLKQVKGALEKITAEFNRCDVLINNAAFNPKMDNLTSESQGLLEDFQLDKWQQDISVGLTGAFLCTQIFGTYMAGVGFGNIINISSDLGLIAPDQRIYNSNPDKINFAKPVSYSVIKHALIGLTRYTATYWSKQGVRCNALAPGGIYNKQDSDFVTRLSNLIPLGRMAEPDDYKGAIQFLISDASKYMTGQVLVVDGGRVCW